MTIRLMTPADLDFAAICVTAEGWRSATRLDFETYLAFDPGCCFVAEREGARAGICVTTAYRRYGFFGELVVVPRFRGRGLGRALLARALELLEARGVTSVSLDADPPGIPLYQKSGFHPRGRSLRLQGVIPPRMDPAVRPLREADLDTVLALDREAFGDDRGFFLRQRFAQFPGLCFALTQDGTLAGYVLGRPGQGVLTAGPWVARPEVAHPQILLEALAAAAFPLPIRLGVLEENRRALTALAALPALRQTAPCTRMQLGPGDGPGASKLCLAIGASAKG